MIETSAINKIIGNFEYNTKYATMYTENRDFPGFTGIVLKGTGNVEIIQSEEHKVMINSNQDITGKIKTEIINSQMVISMVDTLPVWLVSFPKIDIRVYIREILNVKVSGVGKLRSGHPIKAGRIEVYNNGVGGIMLQLEAEEVVTCLKGVGEIELAGKSVRHSVEISGTGKVNAYNLEAENVDVVATGVGECIVFATTKLTYRAGGIGSIKYRGNPELSGQQSGLGSIRGIV